MSPVLDLLASAAMFLFFTPLGWMCLYVLAVNSLGGNK